MFALAVTATPHVATHGYLIGLVAWLLLAGLVAAPVYLGLCWLWPFTACRRCHGLGKKRSPFGRAHRHCWHCDGTGERLRIGRHVLNYLRSIHRASR